MSRANQQVVCILVVVLGVLLGVGDSFVYGEIITTLRDGVVTSLEIEPYAGQDAVPIVSVEDGGTTLHLSGNTWKKIEFDPPLAVSVGSMLEVTFQSDVEGEFHGIGLANSDVTTDGETFIFKLYGIHDFSDPLSSNDFDDYEGVSPGEKAYTIALGDYVAGSFRYLTFITDYDAVPLPSPRPESVFSNIALTNVPEPGVAVVLMGGLVVLSGRGRRVFQGRVWA